MSFPGGYQGKVLRVNLTEKTFSEETLSREVARKFVGGAGFGIKYLFDEVDPGIDALSPENKLIFASGPLSGTSTPCASRMAITTKSPLTGAVGMSLTGGYFPVELKFAGYDVLIIEGKADKPTYLAIQPGKVAFRSAEHLWGMNTFDTQEVLKGELVDQGYRIACIGPAGENLSRIAAIINERRAAGRKGVGAVMGSKNLKAVAVRGNKAVSVADNTAFNEAKKEMLKSMKDSPVLYSEMSNLGTPMVVEATCGLGIFPAKNWSATGQWEPVQELGIAANNSRRTGREHCYMCPVACSQMKLVREGPYAGAMSVPEFESMYCFGGQTGVDNIDSIIAADRLCDELGLDTMSAGVTVGFAMELYEKGIITQEETGGIELNFGNHQGMVALIKQMAFRQGFGDVLADGVRLAAKKIGRGSEKYAMHVKGLELPGYDVRGAKAHGLAFATAYTGADHNRGYAFQEIFGIPIPKAVDRFAIEGKGWLTKWNQDVRTATCDCPTMCAFLLDMAVPATATENSARLLTAVTGFAFTPEEVYQVGERVNNLARVYNVRAGFSRNDDSLPERIMTEPLAAGGSKGSYISREELSTMLDEYYAERDWTKDGLPTPEKLIELGLDEAVAFVAGEVEAAAAKEGN
ncbi:putative oxidoreductase YdhV [Sporomusa carbonis]|uniref:aldehyde ferredoxin oxidoreductase family protein n=1 Tax=Sporomusa carbonis TaxID=3076075 RepID=UPI003A5F0770